MLVTPRKATVAFAARAHEARSRDRHGTLDARRTERVLGASFPIACRSRRNREPIVGIEAVGATPVYLPTYGPELNPIEL